MSQITLPPRSREAVSRWPQKSVTSQASRSHLTSNIIESNNTKRIRVELENVNNIVEQVKKEFNSRAQVNRGLHQKISRNKEQLTELLRQTGELGSNIGSLGAFVSFYAHKYQKCLEDFKELTQDSESVAEGLRDVEDNTREALQFLEQCRLDALAARSHEAQLDDTIKAHRKQLQILLDSYLKMERNTEEINSESEKFSSVIKILVESIEEATKRSTSIFALKIDLEKALNEQANAQAMKLLEIENKEAALKKLQCSVQEAEICIEETKRQLDDESARLETEISYQTKENDSKAVELADLSKSISDLVAESERQKARNEQLRHSLTVAASALEAAESAESRCREREALDEQGLAAARELLVRETDAAERAIDGARAAEQAFSQRFSEKASIMEDIFHLKQKECHLSLQISQTSVLLEDNRKQAEQHAETIRESIERESMAVELVKQELVAAVLEEHEIMADILRASAETELRRTSLTELTLKEEVLNKELLDLNQQVFSLDMKRRESEERAGDMDQLAAELLRVHEDLESCRKRKEALNKELSDLQLEEERLCYSYSPSLCHSARIEEEVASCVKAISDKYENNKIGIEVQRIQFHLAELNAGVASKYGDLLREREDELKRLGAELNALKEKRAAEDEAKRRAEISKPSPDSLDSTTFADMLLGPPQEAAQPSSTKRSHEEPVELKANTRAPRKKAPQAVDSYPENSFALPLKKDTLLIAKKKMALENKENVKKSNISDEKVLNNQTLVKASPFCCTGPTSNATKSTSRRQLIGRPRAAQPKDWFFDEDESFSFAKA